MLDGVPFKPIPELNIVCHMGGLGDSVARMPAVNYILANHQHIQHVNLFVQDYFVQVAKTLLSEHEDRLTVRGYTGMKEFINASNSPGVMCDYKHHTTLRTHITDHAFHSLADIGDPAFHWKQYLKFPKEQEIIKSNSIVITTGFTSPTREFNPQVINKIAKWCVAQGYEVIFLGKKDSVYHEEAGRKTDSNYRDELVDYNIGTDMRDRTTLMQAARIMERAQAVVGLDNGLLHLAACTETPVVFGFTTLFPAHRRPYANKIYMVTPDPKKVPCRFCQSRMSFVYDFDLRTCYTNTYKCITEQLATPYIQGLKEALTDERELYGTNVGQHNQRFNSLSADKLSGTAEKG